MDAIRRTGLRFRTAPDPQIIKLGSQSTCSIGFAITTI
jgi:hypothetical protein